MAKPKYIQADIRGSLKKLSNKKPMPKNFEYYQSQAFSIIENARQELSEILNDARSNDVNLDHDAFGDFLSNVRAADIELQNTNNFFKYENEQ